MIAAKMATLKREDTLKKGTKRPDGQNCPSASNDDAAKLLSVSPRSLELMADPPLVLDQRRDAAGETKIGCGKNATSDQHDGTFEDYCKDVEGLAYSKCREKIKAYLVQSAIEGNLGDHKRSPSLETQVRQLFIHDTAIAKFRTKAKG